MAALDGAIKSLMQGVSQQVPQQRLDGQVSLQQNMLSDVVNGMRRRPGARYLAQLLTLTAATNNSVFCTYVDIEDAVKHVVVNTQTGLLLVLSEDFSTVHHDAVHPYLAASSASSIQAATLRGHMYLANTEKKPSVNLGTAGNQDPSYTGFFFVKTGAFSKTYDLTVSSASGTWTVTHTTPDGTATGDADLAKQSYVAQQLANKITAATGTVTAQVVDAYVYLKSTGANFAVTSNSGSTFMGWSNFSRVGLISDLPARLPSNGQGQLVAVGTVERNFVWYAYNFATSVWVESGSYNSPVGLNDMPIRLALDGTFTVETPTYEGRLSGSDTTNENPAFIENGITGFSVFQGRLVILAGPEVAMSAAGNPLRWYRSTVTSLLSEDPIGIYSGAATSTNFKFAVQFNKDLLLFSRSCQAVIPSSQAAITPQTAQIVITSGWSTDTLAAPSVVGRSVLYSIPRTENYAGVLEMIPSNTTDSQYTSNDISSHIPRYLPGRLRSITASTTSNSSLFLCTGDAYSVFVQDYLWSGDEKVQSAWHQWSFPYPVVSAWFVRDKVYLGLRDNLGVFVVTVEPQAGDTINNMERPYSDVYTAVTITDRTFTVPEALRAGVVVGDELVVTYGDKRMQVGYTVDRATWLATTVRNVVDGAYFVGLKYTSALSPTPPLMRDKDGVVIGTSKSMLVRYELTVKNTGAFDITITDTSRTLTSGEYSGLLYSSNELLPGDTLDVELGRVYVPVRALAQDTTTMFSISSELDMCVLDIEYVLQYRARRKRV